MKFGAMYPQHEMGADARMLTTFSVAAEQAGFDYISYPDHVISWTNERDPPLMKVFDEKDRWQDPFSMLSFLAAKTSTIALHTGICVLPLRPTALTARQAADVDLLSDGRLCLAVGLGWVYPEYEALGQDFSRRGRRMEEQIPLLRQFWTGDLVTFHGEFDHFDSVCLNPPPQRQIPIWMGGSSEAAYQRAARQADGFVFVGDFHEVSERAGRVRAHVEAAGRPTDNFALELMTSTIDRHSCLGPQPSIDDLRRWRDWGGSHGTIASTEQGFTDIEQHIEFQVRAREKILA